MARTTYTEEQMAEIVCRMMDEHNAEPSDDYTASAGQDYGYVAAWELPRLFSGRKPRYAVKYGDNGQTNYAVADDIEDLACWLIPDDTSEDTPQIVANVRGIEAVDAAPDNYAEPCRILCACDYYGPKTETDWVRDDHGNPIEWPTAGAAQDYIDKEEGGTYYLGHNESGRPTYKIVAA